MSEDLVNAMEDAKYFSRIKSENLNVIGWYHSHPHITVWPSNVGKCNILNNQFFIHWSPFFILENVFSVYKNVYLC